jgi:hypothetical protein
MFRASSIIHSPPLTTPPRRGNAPAALFYEDPAWGIICIALHYTLRASSGHGEEWKEMEEQVGVLIVTRHSALRALASHKLRRHGHAVPYGVPGRAAPCGYCGSLVPTPVMALARTLRRMSLSPPPSPLLFPAKSQDQCRTTKFPTLFRSKSALSLMQAGDQQIVVMHFESCCILRSLGLLPIKSQK